MKRIDPAIGWFQIFEVLTFKIDEIAGSNTEYIDNSSDRVSQLFNNTWLCRYQRQCKVAFENGSEFKRDFPPWLNDIDIKPVLMTIKTHKLTNQWSRYIN